MSAYRVSRILLAATLAAVPTTPAFALFGFGDIVFDPTIHGWNLVHESRELIHWAEEIKKFEDFVAEQVATIEKITDLKASLTTRMGDWKGVYDRAVSLRNGAENLRARVGGEFSVVAIADVGTPALLYSNHGLYQPLSPVTAYGTAVAVEDNRLKRYRSVFALHEDLEKSLAAATEEIAAVLTEIAATSREIIEADNQEKLAKLQEKKSTLQLRWQELQRQLDTKLQLLTVQARVNDNRAQLEREVKREQVKQTFQEARDRDAAFIDK